MFLLSLLAAMAACPLRQAEAADDFARSVAEVGAGDVIETVDGGVGDDAGETIEVDAIRAPAPTSTTDRLPPPFNETLSGPGPIASGDVGQAHPPPPDPPRRRALLQRFLF